MPEAKYVEDRKDFNKKIAFKIIPIWILGVEEFWHTALVRISKQIDKIFMGILKKQVVFLYTAVVKTPGIDHLCVVTVVDPNPPVKNASHYFQKEDYHKLRAT